MKRVLVVNTDLSPLNFVSERRALKLMFSGRAEVAHLGERPSIWHDRITTSSTAYVIPATLRLVNRVSRRFTSMKYRKKIMFNRDEWKCQYCGKNLDWSTATVDHVFPTSRGGTSSWKNCVSSCWHCNNKKGQRTPAEASMVLRRNPSIPMMIHFWELNRTEIWHPDWDYLFSN